MRTLAIAVTTLLAALATDGQQLAPRNKEPIKIVFVNITFEDAIGFVAKQAGIEAHFDESATRERRHTKITLKLENAPIEEVLNTLTSLSGLTYKVVDPQTILIYQLP